MIQINSLRLQLLSPYSKVADSWSRGGPTTKEDLGLRVKFVWVRQRTCKRNLFATKPQPCLEERYKATQCRPGAQLSGGG